MMFKPGLLNPLNLEPLSDGSRWRVLRIAKTIIIDEISMVRSAGLSPFFDEGVAYCCHY
jgi:hypothetical protein